MSYLRSSPELLRDKRRKLLIRKNENSRFAVTDYGEAAVFNEKIFLLFSKKVLQFKRKCGIILKLSKRRPVGQAAKTLASHAGNMGSIPVQVTKKRDTLATRVYLFF